jgi:hypothetical protein
LEVRGGKKPKQDHETGDKGENDEGGGTERGTKEGDKRGMER